MFNTLGIKLKIKLLMYLIFIARSMHCDTFALQAQSEHFLKNASTPFNTGRFLHNQNT